MENNFDVDLIKKQMLRKYPYFGAIINNLKYEIAKDNSGTETAETDGKTIYFNPNFLSKLPEQEQVFCFAHEVSHIALDHIMRSKGKNKKYGTLPPMRLSINI
ncbi:MAG: hypothetical protein PHQ62_02325 [Clostridia bacterium]|nr:hypothetical protein [Clostridia bacterium]